nr:type II toxin-antitoxin system HicA family toxin [Campylobacter mucosalis]
MESYYLQNGFVFLRQKGSHKIYFNGTIRQVLPHHAGEILHPKIVKEVLENIKQ